MISNTDSTLLVYSTEHMRVKGYTGKGAQATVSVGVRGCAVRWVFLRVRFRALRAPAASALRRGQGLPPLSPPFLRQWHSSPAALRTGFNSGIRTLSSTTETPASLRSDGVRDHHGMPFGFLRNRRSASPGSPIRTQNLLIQIQHSEFCTFPAMPTRDELRSYSQRRTAAL